MFQRPQHLLTRAVRERPVYYIEEPVFGEWDDSLEVRADASGVQVLRPHIQAGHPAAQSQARTAALLERFVQEEGLQEYDLWVYTPMELPVADRLNPRLTVYDCMDELANFRGAPPELRQREADLMERADLIFTGGHRLYESKRRHHPDAHAFPSSVDARHFAQARLGPADPADQQDIPHPRLGFAGVIDERLDIGLLSELASTHPEWQFVLIGPVVKIDPASLPRLDNVHFLGMKSYTDLPSYLAHWDVALMPFARNEATEFISPTKTPEYLAAGLPVVSTGIHDVIRPYGDKELVRIAEGAGAFGAACAAALAEAGTPAAEQRLARADAFLATQSWDRTWQAMQAHLARAAQRHSDEARRLAQGFAAAADD
ncbi:glycosyl transferase [Deinococcus koreensis]|uniref:Glycosyl transferase n=1 Tax=Deinococcus koreensis TaxID=2054903 RepID=A0A2K3USU1_9DEIO|nr:glycosyl transferase [Deinococcus koreensis]